MMDQGKKQGNYEFGYEIFQATLGTKAKREKLSSH